MMAGWDFGKAFPCAVILAVCGSASLAGCSDPQADQRARLCKEAGLTADVVKECRRSWEDYSRIMDPISAKQEREEIAVFNAALHALPSRTIPKNRYELISLEKLNKEHRDLDLIEESNMPQHPLYGKRFRVKGVVGYHPMDIKNELPEHVSLESEDINDPKNTWSLDADLEPLGREERAFIKTHCEYLLDGCQGEAFGVIGIIRRGEYLASLGLQIEYIELSQRTTTQ